MKQSPRNERRYRDEEYYSYESRPRRSAPAAEARRSRSVESTGRHTAGEGGHEDDSGAQSRVDEVLADAAEHLLDDDDGNHSTQDDDPEGDAMNVKNPH